MPNRDMSQIQFGEGYIYDPVDDEVFDDPDAVVVYEYGRRVFHGFQDSVRDKDDQDPPHHPAVPSVGRLSIERS